MWDSVEAGAELHLRACLPDGRVEENLVQATSDWIFNIIFVMPPAGHNNKKKREKIQHGVYVVVRIKNSI